MKISYDVFLDSEKIGTMVVEKRGLFYRFACTCRLSEPDVYTVSVQCADKSENLGVLIPCGEDLFGLQTQMPVKKLGEGKLSFSMQPKYKQQETTFYPVFEDEPFAHIDLLRSAYLTYQNGQPGISFRT